MAGPFIFMPGSFNNNFPPPPRYEDIPAPQNDAQPQPIIVAVFGKTGTGKSSFIKAVTGKALEIGHGLESCKTTKSSHVSWVERPTHNVLGTKDVLAVPFKIGNQDVLLVDTPGFDDTNVNDTEILTRIADWMKETYDEGSLLSGIIYLHRISDPRMDGASMKNLRMFRKLCGPNNLRNVILATTMWDNISVAEGEIRESQLKKEFWRDMILMGSTVARVPNDPIDAIKLVERFLDKETMVLRLQQELSGGKTLIQTEAGAVIHEDIERLLLQYANDLEAAKKEMREAQKTRALWTF